MSDTPLALDINYLPRIRGLIDGLNIDTHADVRGNFKLWRCTMRDTSRLGVNDAMTAALNVKTEIIIIYFRITAWHCLIQ